MQAPVSNHARPHQGNLRGVPGQCEVCRLWAEARICNTCEQRYTRTGPRCPVCAVRTGAALQACGHCQLQPPPYARTVCVADYAFPWSQLIAAFKFQQQPELAGPLAACLARAIAAQVHDLPQALVPVPLSAARLAQRGYNQAGELARQLGSAWGLPVWHEVLLRPVDTAHQAGLERPQRLGNLRSAFLVEPRHRLRVQGAHVALVDDVMTTGATVEAASHELLRQGAKQVDVWVLARTPAPANSGSSSSAAADI